MHAPSGGDSCENFDPGSLKHGAARSIRWREHQLPAAFVSRLLLIHMREEKPLRDTRTRGYRWSNLFNWRAPFSYILLCALVATPTKSANVIIFMPLWLSNTCANGCWYLISFESASSFWMPSLFVNLWLTGARVEDTVQWHQSWTLTKVSTIYLHQ
jgi:hypothetical protein